MQIIGVYLIRPTTGSIAEACRYHGIEYEPELWAWHEKAGTFRSLHLVELEATIAGDPEMFVSSITQRIQDDPGNDQAAYAEFFLTGDGTARMDPSTSGFDAPIRLCFFLHFLDPAQPLHVGKAMLALPEPTDIPVRLVPFVHYVPD